MINQQNSCYHLVSNDNFRAKEFLSKLSREFTLRVCVYSSPDEVESKVGLLAQTSLFGDDQLSVFRDNHEIISRSLSHLINASVPWVYWETGVKSILNPKEKEKLSLKSTFVSLPSYSQSETVDWIKTMAQKYRITLSHEHLSMLYEFFGNDLNMLQHELQKLFWLTGGENRLVTLQDMEILSSPTKGVQMYGFLDALGGRKKSVIKKYYQKLVQAGLDEWQFFFAICRYVQQLYQAKLGPVRGVPPFVAKKLEQQSRNWTTKELFTFAKRLSLHEYEVKTGQIQYILPVLTNEIMLRACLPET